MKSLKKNQVVIYVIALMLVVAGYLNYTTKPISTIETSAETANVESDTTKTKDEELGDAKLVSNNTVVSDESINSSNNGYLSKSEENNITEKKDINGKNNLENSVEINQDEQGETSSESEIEEKNNINTAEAISNEIDDYFEISKIERNQMYSQMLVTYEEMIEGEKISETQKAIAAEEITKINNIKNAIMICENLISTKGFEQNVIFVNGDSVNIVVRGEEVQENEIAQIQNIISREMKVEIENIHIMNK